MAEVFTLIKDYLLPVVGCCWAGTLVYGRGAFCPWGMFAFHHPISGIDKSI